MQKIGNQTRETLEESGYHILGWLTLGVVVLQANGDASQQEVWFENDDHAGYTVEINGQGYEFARDYKVERDGMYYLETPSIPRDEADQESFFGGSHG